VKSPERIKSILWVGKTRVKSFDVHHLDSV
jgi:hypothetical protein